MSTFNLSKQPVIQREKWAQILDISRQLLSLAQRNDWDSVNSLSLRREQLLEVFFAHGVAAELVDAIQEGIEEIRAIDENIVRLVKKNKGLLADEITSLQTKKKHIQDYISNSR